MLNAQKTKPNLGNNHLCIIHLGMSASYVSTFYAYARLSILKEHLDSNDAVFTGSLCRFPCLLVKRAWRG